MTEFDILKALADHDGAMEWSALLNTFPKHQNEAEGFLQILADARCISGGCGPHAAVTLEQRGRARLAQWKAERRKRAWIDGAMLLIGILTLAATIFGIAASWR